jgi:hypothetical protein
LPELNICIEYQGIQHYEEVEFFNKVRSFESQKNYDQIKRNYCRNNNIKLIEISYLDYKNIENILEMEIVPLKKEEYME